MNLKPLLTVDTKDISNWIALLIAIPLFWWGVTTIIKVAKGG